MKAQALVISMLLSATASAQSNAPTSDGGRWHGTISLANLFDGNINHDAKPIRSYGVVPAAEIVFESSHDPAFAWGYEIASNRFTGTDQWDRISHSLHTVWAWTLGSRLRLETGGAASWRGSSEDRELANEFGVSQRLAYRVTKSTRVVAAGAFRYKQYPDDPGTSGPSPYISAKVDHKFADARRLAVGYKFQSRLSQSQRDRYRRSAYTVAYSMPGFVSADRLAVALEYRPQKYERLIKVAGVQQLRADRRVVADATYERPINGRAAVRWVAGFESRTSNDPGKHFVAPSVGMTMSYRLR